MPTIIHMETEQVRNVAQRLGQAAEQFSVQAQNLSNVAYGMDWQGPSHDDFIAELEQVLRAMNTLADTESVLSQRVLREVDEWERVDSSFGNLGGGLPWGVAGMMGAWGLGYGAGGGATGSWTGEGVRGHSEYFLLGGSEYRAYDGYRAGDMTFAEMIAYANEDPFRPDLVQTEVNFYEFYNEEQSASVAAWEGQYLGDNLQLNLLSAEAKSSQKFAITKDGLDAKADFEVGAYLGKAEYNAELAGIGAAGVAYVGANVQGAAGASLNPLAGDANVDVELEAFVGGKAEGSLNKDFEIAGVDTDLGVRGGVSYGIGAKADIDVGFDAGVLKSDVDIGATLGLGVDVGFTVEIDAQGAVEGVVDFGRDAVDWMFN